MLTTQLVEQYIPLANKIAYQKKRSLPRFIDIEDLRSAAYLGLVEAASRYNPELGICFSTFAYPRINGAILDYVRSQGWLKRGDTCYIVSLDAPLTEESCVLGDAIEAKEECNQEEIFEVISSDLDNQAKSVLRCYFIDELSMKEVGQKFGVSEGRISQLIKEYKDRIRDKWTETDLRIELAA